ncbi:MAG TPA: hypothetical protein VNK43_13575 [Gemmatimonadales bacterium]|nr:hypothetical protein [Gemmatimonadales bacterium]
MRRSLYWAVAMTMIAAGAAQAQETGTPIFKAPYRAFTTYELGGSFSDPGEGVSFALEGFYSYGSGPHDFGVRAGFADFEGDVTAIAIGGNFRTRVINHTEEFPFDGALTVGFGGLLGEDIDDTFLVPVGLSVGRRILLEGSRTSFVPYLHPVLVPTLGGEDDDVQFGLGLGVDIRFEPNWSVRVSGGIGDIEGVGVSFVYVR